ncbi:MAG TPA: riboflavin kinase, partial [Polyangiaceae bacterium]|nr:riboflavin kinase [Polyangiaceae bacterium]
MSRLVVIGNFDGVHRGHQAVLADASEVALRDGLEARLLTFHPHPATVLGRTPPPTLTGQRRKKELVQRDAPRFEVVEQRFDLAFAAQSPRTFAETLATEHRARRVVVGRNFRFGKDRAGDFATLAALGAELGFVPSSLDLVGDELGPYSSTRVRNAIASGDMAGAERVLGRPHMVSGRVARGKELGRTLGFPTANLEGIEEMLPPPGVYATLVDRVDASGARALGLGATSIGLNPTTDRDERVKVETF